MKIHIIKTENIRERERETKREKKNKKKKTNNAKYQGQRKRREKRKEEVLQMPEKIFPAVHGGPALVQRVTTPRWSKWTLLREQQPV